MERLRLPEQRITLPTTGLRVIPPNETLRNIMLAKDRELDSDIKISWSDRERARLQLLVKNPIYKQRYPYPELGKQFMETVDETRHETLYAFAEEMTLEIVQKWQTMQDTPIAVIVFGSVATGLVKNSSHPCPSNIDLAVIGEIASEERNLLFDAIRPKRLSLQTEILASCGEIQTDEYNPGNVGIAIQHTDKLTKSKFGGALEYIAAGARPLFDPIGIWTSLEDEALDSYITREREKRKGSVIFWNRQQPTMNLTRKTI